VTLARQSPEERFVFCKRAAQIGYLPAKFSYSYYSRIASQQFGTVAEPCFVSDPVCFDLLEAQLEDQNLDPALCLPPRQLIAFDATGKAPLSAKQPGEGRQSYELLRKVAVAIAAHYEQRPHGRLNPDTIYWSNDDVSFCPPDYLFDTKFDFYADNDVANGCEPTTSSDVFSFAILAYGLLFRRELLTGRPDRWGGLPVFGFASIGGRPIIPKNLGPTIRSIIRCCWASDPTHRPPMSKVVPALPGDWLDLKPASIPMRPGPLMREFAAGETIRFPDAWSGYGTCRCVKGQKATRRLLVVCHPVGPKQPGNFEWEAHFHAFLDTSHPCLMAIAGHSRTGPPDGPTVVCELEPDATLAQLMGKTVETQRANHAMTETQMCVIVLGLVCGLRQLHSLGFAHLNLSPGNIYVNGTEKVRIGSYFSSSLEANGWIKAPEERGSIYKAPELGREVKDPKKADIFALSFIIYELLTRGNIEGKTEAEGERPEIPLDMNRVVSGLLRRGWSTNPGVRPTIEEFFNELNKIQFHIFLGVDDIELGCRINEWAELRKPGPVVPPADQGKPPAKPATGPKGKGGR
jgi:serine/threonine protein kinase